VCVCIMYKFSILYMGKEWNGQIIFDSNLAENRMAYFVDRTSGDSD
jgi:hypothetical protein